MHRVLILTQGDEVERRDDPPVLPQWKPDRQILPAGRQSLPFSRDTGVSRPCSRVAGRPPDRRSRSGSRAPTNMKDLEREHILATLRSSAARARRP